MKLLKTFSIRNILCPSKPYKEIDKKIENLVKAMNASGVIKTIASCEGHGLVGYHPYIYFKSSVNTASKITEIIRSNYKEYINSAHYRWVVDGVFDQNNELTFLFYSPKLSSASESSIGSLMRFYFFRKKLDQDFLLLEELLFHDCGESLASSGTSAKSHQFKSPNLI